MPEALVQVRDLRVTLSSAILDGLAFEIAPGSITGLCGESGCGKTTLALALLRLLPEPYRVEGSVQLCGRELMELPEREMRRIRGARISMIFQDPLMALNPVLRVGDQVRETMRAHGAAGRPEEALDLAGLEASTRILRAYPHQLSGGERQRVLIAQALACRPALVIADEPFTALDLPRVVELAALFRELRRRIGTSFLVISHNPGVLAHLADSVVVMRAGRIVEQGRWQGFSAPLPKPIRHGCWRQLGPWRGRMAEPFLRIEGLGKTYGGRAVLRHAGFVLEKGSILGLVGASGSGKSTLARCLAGFERPDEGSMVLGGKPLDLHVGQAFSPANTAPRVQLIFQEAAASLNPRFTAEEIVSEPLVIRRTETPAWRRKAAGEWLETVGIGREAAAKSALAFSGGERQRLAIARALAAGPELLIVDESLSGLDVVLQAQIGGLLSDLSRRLELTCILITHDLGLAARLASRDRGDGCWRDRGAGAGGAGDGGAPASADAGTGRGEPGAGVGAGTVRNGGGRAGHARPLQG